MKKKLLLSSVFLSVAMVSAPCSAMEGDNFITTVQGLTGLTLVPEKFTSTLDGYTLPPFPLGEKNRNHFDDRSEGSFTPIKSLVMHYTVCNTPATLNLFTKDIPDNRVSASYVITEAESHDDKRIPGGKVIKMAPDDKRTWHAGVSKWREITNLNGTSLGIENVNKGFTDPSGQERVWYPFDQDQIHSLGLLSQAIVKKYNISPTYVIGHADIAPDRKQDPGILFPWDKLYSTYGVGAWLSKEEQNTSAITNFSPKEPLPQNVSIEFLSTYLKQYGYNIEPTSKPTEQFLNVLKSFKSHFSCNQQPEKYNSEPDENDMLWIWGLNAKYKTL
ncbi:MAG: N-acetylmuramoyl-L-alanine amidase [Candidatus Paracaedibacter sp.]